MREVLAVAAIADDFAGRPVHLLALRDVRLCVLDRRRLRVMHEVVNLLELVGRRVAEPRGARDVRRVALDARAGIDEHHGVASELPSGWSAVTQRARLSELHQAATR